MKKLTKKFIAIVIALLAVTTISASSLVAMASVDGDIPFSFEVKMSNGISREENKRLRTTSNNDNAWMVNLTTSNETDNTKNCGSYFCLGLEDQTLASEWHLVVRGSGEHYYAANDAADFRYVYLQCRDNNNSTKKYSVAGFWDEETGKDPDKV